MDRSFTAHMPLLMITSAFRLGRKLLELFNDVTYTVYTPHAYNTGVHRTVLTIFPLILQTVTIAQMLSTEGKRSTNVEDHYKCWTKREDISLSNYAC